MDAVDMENLIMKVMRDYQNGVDVNTIVAKYKLSELSKSPTYLVYGWASKLGIHRTRVGFMKIDWVRLKEKFSKKQ